MDTRTGEILIIDDNTPQLPKHFVRLGNLPSGDCPRCKGTGIKKITPLGRRIPCPCTNPTP